MLFKWKAFILKLKYKTLARPVIILLFYRIKRYLFDFFFYLYDHIVIECKWRWNIIVGCQFNNFTDGNITKRKKNTTHNEPRVRATKNKNTQKLNKEITDEIGLNDASKRISLLLYNCLIFFLLRLLDRDFNSFL